MTLTILLVVLLIACVVCSEMDISELDSHRMLANDVNEKGIPLVANYTIDNKLTVFYDPPNNHFEPTALAIFVRAYYEGGETEETPLAKIYYEYSQSKQTIIEQLTINSSYATYDSPYIELSTPFKGSRNKTISLCAVMDIEGKTIRSQIYHLNYTVEGGARPYSFGFLVPGIESGGFFLAVELESAAAARAQAAGGQEFADFDTELGIGTYDKQIQALKLTDIDSSLTGFEGGFAYVMPYTRGYGNQHYGILIPYHNGEDFFGKVVRVNLFGMKNASICKENVRQEWYNRITRKFQASGLSEQEACVTVLDLESLYPTAKGFRRGFVHYPYGYLSAGEYSTVARLNLTNFKLSAVDLIDLSRISSTYGGYSGGFADGTWACFNPFRTFAGPIGGIRSTLAVDGNHLRPYYYSTMLCIDEPAWSIPPNNTTAISSHIQILDFSTLEQDLRGFSDVIRVGRYAYFVPLNTADHVYSYKLIRIYLGVIDIGTTLKNVYASGGSGRNIMDILDLSKISTSLRGYSGIFSSGKHLFLVPYRNAYEPTNGQRGHGWLTRLNMNEFSLSGIDYLDLTVTSRNQIPSFADVNLRGFSYGFASGQYGLLVPFFNAVFNGKIARFYSQLDRLDTNLQELDTVIDPHRPNTYKGYRGGFVSLWQGSDPLLEV